MVGAPGLEPGTSGLKGRSLVTPMWLIVFTFPTLLVWEKTLHNPLQPPICTTKSQLIPTSTLRGLVTRRNIR